MVAVFRRVIQTMVPVLAFRRRTVFLSRSSASDKTDQSPPSSTGTLRVLLRNLAIAVFASMMSASLWAAPANEKAGDDGSPPATSAVAKPSPPGDGAQAASRARDQRPDLPTEPRPSLLEGTDLGRMLRRDAAVLPIERMPGGATELDLRGGFRSVLVMHTDSKGKLVLSCVVSADAAEAMLNPKPRDRQEP